MPHLPSQGSRPSSSHNAERRAIRRVTLDESAGREPFGALGHAGNRRDLRIELLRGRFVDELHEGDPRVEMFCRRVPTGSFTGRHS